MGSDAPPAPAAPTPPADEPRLVTAAERDGVAKPDGGGSGGGGGGGGGGSSNHVHPPSAMPFTPAATHRSQAAPWEAMETPVQPIDHGVVSSLRDTAAFGPAPPPDTADVPADVPAAVGAGGGFAGPGAARGVVGEAACAGVGCAPHGIPATAADDPPPAPALAPASAAVDEPSKIDAYGMLRFPDSYCYLTTTYLMLGRDMQFYNAYKAERRARIKADRRAARRDRKLARWTSRVMEDYAREPSQPSLHDDPLASDRDADDGDLVGRPMPSLLSNYSQQGGLVSFVEEEDEERLMANYSRRKTKVNSSSNHSIAPQSLHDLAEGDAMHPHAYTGPKEYGGTDESEWAQLSLHPHDPSKIGSLSKEHLLLRYDSDRERWVCDVHGRNGVVIDSTFHACGQRGVLLEHGAEIFMGWVEFTFFLPSSVVAQLQEREALGEFDDEDENEVIDSVECRSDLDTSLAARRISEVVGSVPSDEEDDAAPSVDRLSKRKSKKTKEAKEPKKPLNKIKLVGKKSRPPVEAVEPTVKGKGKGHDKGKGKGPDKGRGPEKPAAKTEAKSKAHAKPPGGMSKAEGKAKPGTEPDVKAEASREQTTPVAGPVTQSGERPVAAPKPPPQLDPNSAFANVAPSQYPEKRKGPGRPPKNGLLSKRDDAGVKRKVKEFERKGIAIPDLQVVLDMVRTEQRAKDAAAKAQAKGEPMPEMPVASIEASGVPAPGACGLPQPPGQAQPHFPGTGSPNDGPIPRALSPRLQRRAKSPSPIKPESDFTEEELKKPTMTYIYIIDEILSHVEGGAADLQTIYDKIQKRWPYFKYGVNSVGWQSSVRHNLLQCDRFVDAGKSGKGKLWTINDNYELNDKKRKPTPPRQAPVPYGQSQYGQQPYDQYPPSMNGPVQYHANGQPVAGHYASPYPSNGPYPPPPPGQVRQNPNGHYPQQPSQARPPSQQPRQQFNGLVMAIVQFRIQMVNSAPPDQQGAIGRDFDAKIEHVEKFVKAGGTAADTSTATVDMSTEPCKSLLAIFEANKKDWQTPMQTPQPAPPAPNGTPAAQLQTQSGPSAPANGSAPPTPFPGPPAHASTQRMAPHNGQPVMPRQCMPTNAPVMAQPAAQAPSPQPQGVQQLRLSDGFAASTSGAHSVPPPHDPTQRPPYTHGLPAAPTVAAPATNGNGCGPLALRTSGGGSGGGGGGAAVATIPAAVSSSQTPIDQKVAQPQPTAGINTAAPLCDTRPTSAGVKRPPEGESEVEAKRVKTCPAWEPFEDGKSPE